jgi:Ca2+-binding RTX toxin-like protein
MDQIDFANLAGGTTTGTPTLIRTVVPGGSVVEFFGDFEITNGVVTGGTLTGIREFFNGLLVYEVTGVSVSASAFYNWALTGQTFTALSAIFAGADTITGTQFDDYLLGFGGNDIIDGGLGADTMNGGTGDDTYFVDNPGDRIIEGGGFDTAVMGYNFSAGYLATFIERFVFGSGVLDGEGSNFSDILEGNALGNVILGLAGNDTLLGLGGDDFLRGGEGDDIIDGGAGFDTASYSDSTVGVTVNLGLSTYQITGFGADWLISIEQLNGSNFADRLTGSSGADTLLGLSGDDILMGMAGNDVLNGGAGSDTLDGGTGIDAALYSGVRRQYTASSTSVSSTADGTDTLVSIEEARFVDGVLTFDATSASAQVMRLYSATLNRVPDQGGLEANVGALAALGLQGVANTFVASAEFQARFGALNNQQFVEQLYVFALGRAGDAPGIASWVALLNGGASRGQVVVGFSESAENVGRTAATLNAGLWVPDQQALIIARLYDATFKRLPDVGGLTGWVNALKGGASVTDIAAAFAGSAEFQATFGALSNQAFVEQLYRFCLNREGDAGGIAGWVNALNNGTSRASVLLGFSESAEHVALTANLWLGGIRFAGFVGAPAEDAAKDMDGPQILPDVEVVDIAYDPADLGLSFPDKDADAFVLPAVPDMPLPTVDPAAVFDGLDLAVLRLSASRDARMMLTLPEGVDFTPEFDLDAWSPAQRDGHWLM